MFCKFGEAKAFCMWRVKGSACLVKQMHLYLARKMFRLFGNDFWYKRW